MQLAPAFHSLAGRGKWGPALTIYFFMFTVKLVSVFYFFLCMLIARAVRPVKGNARVKGVWCHCVSTAFEVRPVRDLQLTSVNERPMPYK